MSVPLVEITDTVDSGVDAGRLERLVGAVLAAEEASTGISVALVDDAAIRVLHRDFQGKDSATDVLSFPLDDDAGGPAPSASGGGTFDPGTFDPGSEGPGGEVVVSVDTARREAEARGVPFEAELSLYVIHGVLHILGYDDLEDAPRARMREAEARHLAAAGYPADLFAAAPREDAKRKEEDS